MLVLYFDYPSLAAAVSVLRFDGLVRHAQVSCTFRGLDALGVQASLPVTLDQLAELDSYRDRALALGLEVRRPATRPPTLDAHLVGELAEQCGLGPEWREVALRAYWTAGADLAERQVLVGLAEQVGLRSPDTLGWLDDGARRQRLRMRMQADRGRGVGGVPVLEFDGALVPADLSDRDLRLLTAL